MTIASIQNIETVLGRRLTGAERQRAHQLLAHTENLIAARVPSLENLCAEPTFAATVAEIETAAVARVLGDSTPATLCISENELARLRQNNGLRVTSLFADALRGSQRLSLSATGQLAA